ncbi:MAG TPA: F0F1 ATP synthase subunit B [Candidatus Saccharimonadales bacterium]|nr:F0F1 ATP synthase subunit B [Candidatus Saccharimonadales bacterium]
MYTLFAAEAAGESAGLLGALGINWKLFVTQLLAFMVLVAIIGKFVIPPLTRSIDKRRESIEEGLQQAKEAREASEKAEQRVATMLAEARTEADDIIARSKTEANAQVAEAEEKARARADQIVKDAHTQLEADIAKARVALKKDTAALVAMATERILREKIDSDKDAKLIDRALAEEAGGWR